MLFLIKFINNKLDIINYKELLDVSINKISVKYDNGILDVIGSDLVIKKLVSDEVLIIGNIKSLEFR
ncbi:MAG: YabP/YqfC family sporulation protein [Bacilli bacterium]|nr:YabP/YqfC family sporulation protein [Bacilli bacterium]